MISEINTEQERALQLLRRIHFFHGLNSAELEHLSLLVSIINVPAGETIFRQGDPPEAFYIIEHGKVDIIRETPVGQEVIATLGRRGDFFGEMALIEERPRSATVRAAAETELLVIARTDFVQLIQEHPAIHLEVSRALSYNLRRSDARFAEKILEKNLQLSEALNHLKAAQEELLKRERLSLVGKLTSSIIHDLRKPLTCINGYAQLLAKPNLSPQKRTQYSDTIISEVQRLVNMINEILRFARGEHEISARPVNLAEWIEEVSKFLRRDFRESGIVFKKSINYKGKVEIDPEKFRNVIYNIATNALAAMPEGGTFTLNCRREGDKLRMEFADTGVGMDEEVLRHVFEDFFTQRKDGTGLGMAIVKRIVESHKGTISIESALGKGTRVVIHLPLPSEESKGENRNFKNSIEVA